MFVDLRDNKEKPYTINMAHIEYVCPKFTTSDNTTFETVIIKMDGDYIITITAKEWFRIKESLTKQS